MIEKERLKQLIEQGATVYCPYYMYYDGVELDNQDYVDDKFLYIFRQVWKKEGGYDKFPFRCLFETKEDAEFALEFQDITRTETLNLPTWEDIENGTTISFTVSSRNYQFMISKSCNFIAVNYCGYTKYFFKSATKENFLEACKIVKKLFLGEKI